MLNFSPKIKRFIFRSVVINKTQKIAQVPVDGSLHASQREGFTRVPRRHLHAPGYVLRGRDGAEVVDGGVDVEGVVVTFAAGAGGADGVDAAEEVRAGGEEVVGADAGEGAMFAAGGVEGEVGGAGNGLAQEPEAGPACEAGAGDVVEAEVAEGAGDEVLQNEEEEERAEEDGEQADIFCYVGEVDGGWLVLGLEMGKSALRQRGRVHFESGESFTGAL